MKTLIAAAAVAVGLMGVSAPASAQDVHFGIGYHNGYYDRDYYDRDRYDRDRYWRSGYDRYRGCNHWQWQAHPDYCRRLMWRMRHY